jgi:hypothetical protein
MQFGNNRKMTTARIVPAQLAGKVDGAPGQRLSKREDHAIRIAEKVPASFNRDPAGSA